MIRPVASSAMTDIAMHIGMNKAGSSSIQVSLKTFDDGRVRYARLGGRNHSARIVSMFCLDVGRNKLLSRRNVTAGEIAQVRPGYDAELSREIALGRDTLVISGEAIGHLTAPDLLAMKSYFDDRGCRIRLFAYIREPLGFMSSAFQQTAKGGKSRFLIEPPLYREQFQSFIEVFGRDSIEFADFRKERLRGGSVVPDFAARIGVDPATITEVRMNESLSATAVALLYFWNRDRDETAWSRETAAARNRLAHVLRHRFPGRFKLSSRLVRRSLDFEDIAWMERVSGIDLRFAIDAADETEVGAIGSEADLAAARDAGLPDLAALLDELGVERPRKPTPVRMVHRLFRHLAQEARQDIVRRKPAEAVA